MGQDGDVWSAGDAYERYIGRWSRLIAEAFVPWLGVPPGRRWLDVGCGTGVLTAVVVAMADPLQVVGVDPSEAFLDRAREQVEDERAVFRHGDAQALPLADGSVDAVVSGLALNFVPDPERAVAEFARVVNPGGAVAAYVWDYAGGMAMLRHFWDAAADLAPEAADLDEGRRFPICLPEPLTRLWTDAGLTKVTVQAIEVPSVFPDFDHYWQPFLGGQGPAPGYVASLSEERRRALREHLRERLPSAPDGSLTLPAAAWAIKGTPV